MPLRPAHSHWVCGERRDCDDEDPLFSWSIEVCDDADNDCDGAVDIAIDRSTFYADADDDGYGDAAARCPPARYRRAIQTMTWL